MLAVVSEAKAASELTYAIWDPVAKDFVSSGSATGEAGRLINLPSSDYVVLCRVQGFGLEQIPLKVTVGYSEASCGSQPVTGGVVRILDESGNGVGGMFVRPTWIEDLLEGNVPYEALPSVFQGAVGYSSEDGTTDIQGPSGYGATLLATREGYSPTAIRSFRFVEGPPQIVEASTAGSILLSIENWSVGGWLELNTSDPRYAGLKYRRYWRRHIQPTAVAFQRWSDVPLGTVDVVFFSSRKKDGVLVDRIQVSAAEVAEVRLTDHVLANRQARISLEESGSPIRLFAYNAAAGGWSELDVDETVTEPGRSEIAFPCSYRRAQRVLLQGEGWSTGMFEPPGCTDVGAAPEQELTKRLQLRIFGLPNSRLPGIESARCRARGAVDGNRYPAHLSGPDSTGARRMVASLPADCTSVSFAIPGFRDLAVAVPASSKSNVDLGAHTLHVSESIRGRLMSSQLGPVENVEVLVHEVTDARPLLESALFGSTPVPPIATSVARVLGDFVVDGLDPGTYLLSTRTNGRVQFLSDGIVVKAGDQVDLGEVIIDGTAELLVSVRSEGFTPQQPTKVQVMLSTTTGGCEWLRLSTSYSLADGALRRVPGLRPGSWKVEVIEISDSGLPVGQPETMVVVLEAGEAAGAEQVLEGQTYTGRLVGWRDGELPASISLVGRSWATSAVCSADGFFHVRLAEPGRYRAEITTHGTRNTLSIPNISFSDAEKVVSIPRPAGEIHGLVLGPDGGEVSGALVRSQLKVAPLDGRADDMGRVTGELTESDVSGRFTLDGLVTGTWLVRAEHGDLSSEEQEYEIDSSDTPGELVLKLERSATVELALLSAGRPMADISVFGFSLTNGRSLISGTSDSEGRLSLEVPTNERGPFSIQFEHPGGNWVATLPSRGEYTIHVEGFPGTASKLQVVGDLSMNDWMLVHQSGAVLEPFLMSGSSSGDPRIREYLNLPPGWWKPIRRGDFLALSYDRSRIVGYRTLEAYGNEVVVDGGAVSRIRIATE